MQVYKGMDIGTAKITQEVMKGLPHELIDIKELNDDFSVAEFQKHVQNDIDKIFLKQKTPIIVGGSGLYIQATLFNYSFSEQKRNSNYTKKLEEMIANEGIWPLYQYLQEVDPV